MATETLSGAPSLPLTLARAAVTAGRRRGGQLPDTTLQLPAATVDVDALHRYQRLCGWPVADVLPHTWPHVMGFPLQAELMARGAFPLPLPGLVHVANAITVHRPLLSSERLDLAVRAEALRPHRRGTLVDLVTEVTVDGERVWEGRSTYLRRGPRRDDAPAGEEPPALPEGPAAARWRLPGGLGRDYAAVSGDVNPIHLHPLTARALGFPRAIAHGMWTFARTLALLGPRSAGPSRSRVWFEKPVLLPGTVEAVVRVDGRWSLAGLRRPDGTPLLALVLEER